MRYVIIVLLLAGFIAWDAVSNGGQATDTVVRGARGLLRTLGI